MNTSKINILEMMNIFYGTKSLITNYMKSSIKFLSIDILWWKRNKFQKSRSEILEDSQREYKKEYIWVNII
jgi:hypothetical protein